MDQQTWIDISIEDVVQRINDRREDPIGSGLQRYVGVEHLDADDLTLRNWGEADKNSLPPTFRFAFPAGVVLLPTRRPALRKCAVAGFAGITGEKILVLKPKDPSTLDAGFLPYLLASEKVRRWVIDRAVGSVTPHFRWRDLAEFRIALPPITEQKKIARALASARTLLETMSQARESLIQVRRAAQNELLLADSSGTMCELQDLADLNPADGPLSAEDPFITMDAIEGWVRRITVFEKKGTRGGVRARAGDVLMARITPCLQNGKIAQVPETVPRCGGSTEFIVLRARQTTNLSYLYWLIASDKIRDEAVARMSGTTGRQRVSASDLRELRVPLLSPQRQTEVGTALDAIDTQLLHLQTRIAAVRRVYSALWDHLLTPVTR